MSKEYYTPCRELDLCREIDKKYWETDKKMWFTSYLPLAEQGYPLAECQIGYAYSEGIGVEPDPAKAFHWTRLAAEHGDWDGQFNLGSLYEEGIGIEPDLEKAKYWYLQAARQAHDLAIQKCESMGVKL